MEDRKVQRRKSPWNKKIRDNWAWILVIVSMLFAGIFILIKGQNVYIQIHDNLDSNIVWLKMLKDNGLFWKHDVTVPFLGNEISRDYLSSQLKLYNVLYMLFPVFVAYIIGGFIRVFMSVFGWLWLSKCIWKDNYCKYKNLMILGGFIYGIIPLYPTASFAFASLPILFVLLYKINENPSVKWYVLVFLYATISDFVLFGIFACGYLLIYIIFDGVRKRRIPINMLAALLLLSLGYVVVEYRLFYTMLLSGEETIRNSMTNQMSIKEVLNAMMEVTVNNIYHAGTLQKYFVLPVCCLYFIILNVKYLCFGERKKILTDRFNLLIYWFLFNVIVYGLDSLYAFRKLISDVVPVLSGFSFARTIWFNPMIIYLAFFIILKRIMDRAHVKLAYMMACIAIMVVMIFPEYYNDIGRNIRSQIKIFQEEVTDLTYDEFYSEELFQKIKQDINYNNEPAVAFGYHPAVLEYNGFLTLDGYVSCYSEDYKEQFRMLIAPALDKSERYRNYFDNWGGRAYIFDETVSYAPVREMLVKQGDIDFDVDVFKQMDGKYVLSRVSLTNADEKELEFVNEYKNDTSPYTIYVYKVKD